MNRVSELSVEGLQKGSEMLKAMAHPLRLSIVRMLDNDSRLTVTTIYTALQIEQSTASHHLGILKNKGIVECERIGKNIFYSLKESQLSQIVDCICGCSK